jgi:hypothetical protein
MQEGISLIFIAIILAAVMLLFFAMLAFFRSSSETQGSKSTATSFAAIQAALEQFASTTGRLPCPANPALSTGDPDPNAANVICNSAAGSVPWHALGLRSEDALDPWGGKISYRVYSGVAGSLTQNFGASMVLCDTAVDAGSKAALDANKLCQEAAGWHSDQADFLTGKGLAITDFGAAQTGVAFILISHGPSGLGSYASMGAARGAPTNAAELGNTQAAGPFTAQAASGPAIGPNDANHFDDVVLYEKIADLARRANIAARDWPDPLPPPGGPANVKLDAPTLTAALGFAPGFGDLGQQTIAFTNATVTGFDSGGDQNLAFGQQAGNVGLGGAGGSGNGLSATGGEGVRIVFNQDARRFAVTLNAFNVAGFFAEQVELKFFNGASVVATLTKQACHSGSGLASFASVDPGADFDKIEIRALNTTAVAGFSLASSFYLSEFKTCATGVACHTSLETAGNLCP